MLFYRLTERFGGYSYESGVCPSVNIFVFALKLENHLEYFDDTSQLCRTGHDNVLRTEMRDIALILFELSPFDALLARL